MFTSKYTINHDPPQQKLRHLLCNEYWVPIPTWLKATAACFVSQVLLVIALSTNPGPAPHYKVAFIGNGMQSYNDFPRMMEALSDNHITQDCCLHTDADLSSILIWGSGTFAIWHTGTARIDTAATVRPDNASLHQVQYDMGACTVQQLLLGYDRRLDKRMQYMEENGYFAVYTDDDKENNHNNNNNNNMNNQEGNNNNNNNNAYQQLNDDAYTYEDGKNPCYNDADYYYYRQDYYDSNGPTKYDFVVLNDRSRNPARGETRNASLAVLEHQYVKWFVETGATPIFIVTYGYDTPYRDMSGLSDVATFTSLTYEGYKEYAELVGKYLPDSQQPRLALVGLAFLMVYEENPTLWQKLFHLDRIHASPHGSFLQGCVVHHAIFGRLPPKNVALRNNMSALWNRARRMQPRKHTRLPMPTKQEAEYLYHIAERVTVRKQLPATLIRYKNHEASDYIPNDGIYADNDIHPWHSMTMRYVCCVLTQLLVGYVTLFAPVEAWRVPS